MMHADGSVISRSIEKMGRLVLPVLLAVAMGTAPASAVELKREVVLRRGAVHDRLPAQLLQPEGRSRWELTGLARSDLVRVRLEADGNTVTLFEKRQDGDPEDVTRTVYSDFDESDDAVRWFFPDHFSESLRPGERHVLEFDEATEHGFDRLRIQVSTIGIGWVHLPSGPHETVLQRVLILRAPGGSRGFAPDTLVHRWVDPLAGVVAEVRGPATLDGRSRSFVEEARVLESMLSGASTLKIHVSEIAADLFGELLFGFDVGNTPVSSLDPNAYATIGDLIASDEWDFSGITSGTEAAFTAVPIDSTQTCNTAQCGYSDPNGILERTDIGFDDPDPANWTKINTVIVWEDRPSDVTLWVRGGSINEGVSGGFGTGESRICYETFGGVTRTEVPLWRFSHLDPNESERYFQAGDSWSSGQFNCEQNIFNEVCGGGGLFSQLYSKACTGHTGTQFTEVLKGGVVTLPSGHTFNALLVRTVADFCVNLFSGCPALGDVDEVKTVNYLWQVPHIGSVVRLESEQNEPDLTSFTSVVETNITYGLLPPRSITVTGTTDTTASISWDPGLITTRIDEYKVYWDTDSGSNSSYAFNSVDNPGQIAIAGTTATITGLTAGTSYHITVTSRSTFPPDPNTPLPRVTYESLLFPTTISGDPSFVYPVEVQATTTGGCAPAGEVSNLTVAPDPAGIQICWDALDDPCLAGYRVLGSDTVDSDAGYGAVADLGVTTCWTGDPTGTFFLVTGTGAGGEGPWGHYGR
jgi:hypothetical protein